MWLNIFKKIEQIAANPITIGIVGAVNPLAGALLTTAVQAIVNVQQVLPDNSNGNDALKKKLVTDLMNTQGSAMGLQMDAGQTSVLVEGLLKAIKDAANTPVAPVKPKL